MRARIWCETLSHAEVATRAVCTLLHDHRVELALAVRPADLATLAVAVAALTDAGVSVSLWPMVADDDGRWFHRGSFEAHRALVAAIVAQVPRSQRGELVLDHEPHFPSVHAITGAITKVGRLRTLAATVTKNASAAPKAVAENVYSAWISSLEAEQFSVGAALMPTTLLPTRRVNLSNRLERAFGLLPPIGSGRKSVMLYRSMVVGWSGGVITAKTWPKILAAASRRTATRFGTNADISLGLVGSGALGNEPIYATVSELAEDLAIVRQAGISSVTLFDLGGLLRRGAAERWLAVLTE